MLRRKAETMRVLVLVAMFFLFPHSEAASNNLMSPDNIQCACVGDVLTFTCSIVGGGNTIWRGSAFDCPSTNNEIILRHSQFSTQSGTSGSCNSGTIVGQSVGVEDTCFTSRLNVSISEGLNDRTVQCDHNNLDAGTTNIGSATLNVLVTNPYPPPNDVNLIDFDQRQVTFNWTSVSSSCPTIDYVITSDCGVCLSSTNSTTVTCFDLQLPTRSDDSVCSFNVSSRVCGIVGNQSTSVLAARVPGVPIVNVVPHYSNQGNQALMELSMTVMSMNDATEVIINDISGSILSYIVAYSTPTTLIDTSSIPVESLSCQDNVCNFTVTVPSSVCSSSSDINVAVSAANRIGRGQSSDGFTIGCTNKFVQVEYDKTASTITCRFLDETDTSVKLCTVMYGKCGQEFVQTTQGSSTMETPNNIVLSVDVDSLECYNVTASSDELTVIVKYNGTIIAEGGVAIAAIVVPIVVLLLLAVAIVLFLILTPVFIKRRKKSRGHFETNRELDQLMTDLDKVIDRKFQLQMVVSSFESHDVGKDCELKEFFDDMQSRSFERGHIFYEFVHEFENITEDQELIFMSLKQKEFYTHNVNVETLKQHKLLGDKLPKPNTKCYKVFVQSTGSGARHLPKGSMVLYELNDQNSVRSKPDPPLKPIISDHFKTTTVTSKVTIKEFCQDNEIPNDYSIFLELRSFTEKKSDVTVIDVILQDKTESLYTGPTARNMVDQYYSGCQSPNLNLDERSVFVLCQFDKNMELEADTVILHQKPGFTQIPVGDFEMLTVDANDSCMCMSDFVKEKLNLSEFTNGHAFFEFKKEEDLLYYKDIIYLPSRNDKVYMGIDLFYRPPAPDQSNQLSVAIGAPRDGVMPPKMKSGRVFIQSTSQGARCVKPGDTILYKKKKDGDSDQGIHVYSTPYMTT